MCQSSQRKNVLCEANFILVQWFHNGRYGVTFLPGKFYVYKNEGCNGHTIDVSTSSALKSQKAAAPRKGSSGAKYFLEEISKKVIPQK